MILSLMYKEINKSINYYRQIYFREKPSLILVKLRFDNDDFVDLGSLNSNLHTDSINVVLCNADLDKPNTTSISASAANRIHALLTFFQKLL